MRSAQYWTDATVLSKRDVTPTVREFNLKPADGVLPQSLGGHLQLQLLMGGKVHTRSYSLVGPPGDGIYRIAVKRLDAGRGGSLAMWRLAAGDRLRISEPQNHFSLNLNAPAYLLVAGGIGVTPLLHVAQVLAQRATTSGQFLRMAYAARTDDELAYGAELRAVLGERLCTAISARGQRLNLAHEIAALPRGAQMLVCGPATLLDAARRAWGAAGRAEADIRFETFGSSGRFAPQAFRVRIPRHRLDIVVPADTSLLDALDAAGVWTIADCKRGECGLCAMDVLAVAGDIDHRDVFLSDDEKQRDTRICTCVSRVVGDITLDSSYRPDT